MDGWIMDGLTSRILPITGRSGLDREKLIKERPKKGKTAAEAEAEVGNC